MKVEDLLGQSGEWLKGTGPENDVIISSRVRLARNLGRFPFLTVASAQSRTEIEKFVRGKLEDT
jgi:protein arginine kinase